MCVCVGGGGGGGGGGEGGVFGRTCIHPSVKILSNTFATKLLNIFC